MLARLRLKMHFTGIKKRAEKLRRNQVFAHLNVILSNPFVSFVWSPCGFPLQGLSTFIAV